MPLSWLAVIAPAISLLAGFLTTLMKLCAISFAHAKLPAKINNVLVDDLERFCCVTANDDPTA
jgi:hypothetical protein